MTPEIMTTETSARVLCDSINDYGNRLITMEVTFPRIVLSEFNTHRQFSRNSASSRAIPIQKQIDRVMDDPFVPKLFPINRPGMSADVYITEDDARYEYLRSIWLSARDSAVDRVKLLHDWNIHKQIGNRLLEPFLWHTALVSSTEWENFFTLRRHATAQPEIRELANRMWEVRENSTPEPLRGNEWHLPLVTDDEKSTCSVTSDLVRLSAGRCARVSYDRHHDDEPREKTMERADLLMKSGHWSPWEHQAIPRDYDDTRGNFVGWEQARHIFGGKW